MPDLQSDSGHVEREYTMASAFVWLLFEYFLTLDQEVELFWGRGRTGASVLIVSNRYFPLLLLAWWTPWWRSSLSFEACVVQQLLGGLGEYLLFIPVAAFSAMRAYALSGRKRSWAIVVFLLSISPLIFSLVLIPWLGANADTDGACDVFYGAPTLVMDVGTICVRFFLVLADLIVLGTTWSATYRRMWRSHRVPSLCDILFRDGTIYFVAQLFLNILYLVSILVPPSIFDAEDLNSIASVYVGPATSVLITHFLLDLQQASRRTIHLSTMNTSNWERVMGSVVLVSPELELEEGEGDCRCDALVSDAPAA